MLANSLFGQVDVCARHRAGVLLQRMQEHYEVA